jgi:hypothetical protein
MRLPSWLWPIKTGATLFDVWTICHIASWIVYGFNMCAMHATLVQALALGYVLAAAWEVIEAKAEVKWPDIWKHKEVWYNRWISDVLIDTSIGAWLGWWLCNHQ